MGKSVPSHFDRLVLVSYRLPFRLHRNKVFRNAGGLVSAVLSLAEKGGSEVKGPLDRKIVWIGKTDNTPEELAQVQKQVTAFQLVHVYTEEKLDARYYGGFCNDMIWPLFHYFPLLANFDAAYFEAYQEAHVLFLEQVAKEYLACQKNNLGVLILSEMAGAAAELSEAILINPTDKAEVAAAIARALDMPLADRQAVLERMQRRLQTYDVFAWAKDFFDTMDRTKQEQHVLKVRLVNRAIENQITQKYHKASRRIIFLDYDGTLVPFSKYPETAVPDERVMAQLRRLAAEVKNTVVIVSGRGRDFLDKWFGDLPIDLIAEHGAFIRTPTAGWTSEVDADPAWKQRVLPVLQRYADRCTGAFIEEKSFSLVWHYRNADPEIALLRSQELKDQRQVARLMDRLLE